MLYLALILPLLPQDNKLLSEDHKLLEDENKLEENKLDDSA